MGTRGRIRSLVRRGSRSDMSPAVAKVTGRLPQPTVCERCGAVFTRRTWRWADRVSHARLARAAWGVCPACQQVRRGLYFGRVVIRGAYAAVHEDAIRRRIANVASRAAFTQPQRRVVSVGRSGTVFEVLTTSQKLAHRIVHELKKTFRGRVSYAWSDRDGGLFATWERDDVPAESQASRRR